MELLNLQPPPVKGYQVLAAFRRLRSRTQYMYGSTLTTEKSCSPLIISREVECGLVPSPSEIFCGGRGVGNRSIDMWGDVPSDPRALENQVSTGSPSRFPEAQNEFHPQKFFLKREVRFRTVNLFDLRRSRLLTPYVCWITRDYNCYEIGVGLSFVRMQREFGSHTLFSSALHQMMRMGRDENRVANLRDIARRAMFYEDVDILGQVGRILQDWQKADKFQIALIIKRIRAAAFLGYVRSRVKLLLKTDDLPRPVYVKPRPPTAPIAPPLF
jgi:hypothetical protein